MGRISYVEGQLLQYVPEDKNWVATVQDAPFGMEDALYAGEGVKAEFIMPNNTWLRVGDNTEIQLISLQDDITEVAVESGIARFYNKGSQAIIKATTPFGAVIAPGRSTFDLYVGNESVEVIALKGTVDFVHVSGNTKYPVMAGSASILADSTRVTSGSGIVNAQWDAWNDTQDNLWQNRLAKKGNSVKYLPPDLQDEAYALEDYGTWDSVYYDGAYRNFWRPTYVGVGWAPYSVGRWTVWYGDNCWIPYEPFGYVTHHYGSWLYVNSCNCWYWAPPIAYIGVARGPYLGCAWYPGRVSWIYNNMYVGWVPLAPWETYYSYRYWGPSSVVVNNITFNNYNVKHHHAHDDHAVIVKHHDLYTASNYNTVRVKTINAATIAGNYRAAPVINEQVISGFPKIKEKYNFTNALVRQKPDDAEIQKIAHTRVQALQVSGRDSRTIKQQLATLKTGEPVRGIALKQPQITKKTAPAGAIRKPGAPLTVEEHRVPKPAGNKTEGTEPARQKGRLIVIPSPESTQGAHREGGNELPKGVQPGREEIHKARSLPPPPKGEHPTGELIHQGQGAKIRELPKPPQHEQAPRSEVQTQHPRRQAVPKQLPPQSTGVNKPESAIQKGNQTQRAPVQPEQYPASRQPAPQPQRAPQSQIR